jgi:hypothetical protein
VEGKRKDDPKGRGMRQKDLKDVIEDAVYETLGNKFRNFLTHIHFFTHGKTLEFNVPNEPLYTFLLRRDKGAKGFKSEYDAKVKELRIDAEFEETKYIVHVSLECTKEKSSD